MAHHHRKSGQPPFNPGSGNHLPYYAPPWENNFNYMQPLYGHDPNYPFAPYPRYCPQQHYLYYNQPCYYCHGQQSPGQQPYPVNHVQNNPNPQQHPTQEQSIPAVQYPVRHKKQKHVPNFSQAEPESNSPEQPTALPNRAKHRSKD